MAGIQANPEYEAQFDAARAANPASTHEATVPADRAIPPQRMPKPVSPAWYDDIRPSDKPIQTHGTRVYSGSEVVPEAPPEDPPPDFKASIRANLLNNEQAPNAARGVISLGQRYGMAPATVGVLGADGLQSNETDRFLSNLSSAGAVLNDYAAEDPTQAKAISDDMDNLGPLGFILDGETDPQANYIRGAQQLQSIKDTVSGAWRGAQNLYYEAKAASLLGGMKETFLGAEVGKDGLPAEPSELAPTVSGETRAQAVEGGYEDLWDQELQAKQGAEAQATINKRFAPDASEEELDVPDTRTAPGWLLSVGGGMYKTYEGMKDLYNAAFHHDQDPTKDASWRAANDMNAPAPGEGKGLVADSVHALAKMAPLIAAGTVGGPIAALGVMYSDGRAESYKELRRNGLNHEEASDFANLIGFTSAAAAMVSGEKLFGAPGTKKAADAAASSAASLVLKGVLDRPTTMKFIRDAGRNQIAATISQMSAAAVQITSNEFLNSSREGRDFNYTQALSDFNRSTWDSLLLAPLSLYAAGAESVGRSQRYQGIKSSLEDMRLQEHLAKTPAEAAASGASPFAPGVGEKAAETFFKYEDAGKRLLSLKSAHDLNQAAAAVKGSSFMEQNRAEGEKLIQRMLNPTKSQNVFVDPKALLKLPRATLEELQANGLHAALQTGEKVAVPAEKYYTSGVHDEVGDDATTEEDLHSPNEMREALKQEEAAKEEAVPSGASGVEVDPELFTNKADPPEGAYSTGKSRRAWAEAELEGRPISHLPGVAEKHATLAGKFEDLSLKLQKKTADAMARSASAAQKGIAAATGAGQGGTLAEPVSPKRADNRGQTSVEEEVKAGDLSLQAYEAERKQKLNDAMSQAAARAFEQAKRAMRDVRDYVGVKPGAPDPRGPIYAGDFQTGKAWDALAEAMGESKVRGQASQDVGDAFDSLRTKGYRLEDLDLKGDDIRAANKLIANPHPLEAMTVPEAQSIAKVLKAFKTATGELNQVRLGKEVSDLQQIVERTANHLASLPDTAPGQNAAGTSKDALTGMQKAGAKIAAVKSELLQPQVILQKLGPEGDKLVYDGMVPALARRERLQESIGRPLEEITNSMPKELIESGKDIIPALGQMTGSRTRSDAWRLMLHLGTESGVNEISRQLKMPKEDLLGYAYQNLGRTPEERVAVMDNMIAPMWEKVFKPLWSEYEQAFERAGRAPPQKLKGQRLVIEGKVYEGGYGGQLRWNGGIEQSKPLGTDTLADLKGPDYAGLSTGEGQLQERDGQLSPSQTPDLNFYGTMSSVNASIHNLSMDSFVMNAHKVLANQDMRDLIANKLGTAQLNQLYNPTDPTDWLHTLARGKIQDIQSASAITQALYNVQGRVALNAFSMNFRVLLKQFSHLPIAMIGQSIGAGSMADGISKAFDADRRAWAHGQSQVLALRASDFERRSIELQKELTGVDQGQTPIHRLIDRANWALWEHMDGHLSHAIWEAKMSSLPDSMPFDQKVREADRATYNMMPAQSIYERSAFARDRSAVALFTLTRNFENTLYNVGAMNAWNNKLEYGTGLNARSLYGAAKTGLQFVGMTMASEVLSNLMVKWMDKDDDRPGKDSMPVWAAKKSVAGLFYPIGLSPVAEGATELVAGKPREAAHAFDQMLPPALGAMSSLGQDTYKALNNKDPEKAFDAALRVGGIITKVPFSSLRSALRVSGGLTQVPGQLNQGLYNAHQPPPQ